MKEPPVNPRQLVLEDAGGPVRVADLNIPFSLLNHAAARLVEHEFLSRFCFVAAHDHALTTPQPHHAPPAAVLPPPLRGFRFAVPGAQSPQPAISQPFDSPADAPRWATNAAAFVNARLAADGLLRTTAAIIARHPAPSEGWTPDTLASVGLPLDLLALFRPRAQAPIGSPRDSAARVIAEIRAAIGPQPGRPLDRKRLERELVFHPAPTHADWSPCDEAGATVASLIRVQLSRTDYLRARGDGGSWDLFTQLLAVLPETRFQVCVGSGLRDAARASLEALGPDASSRCELISVDAELSQWAADNGKPGMLRAKPATLVPRYASRAEAMSRFVPGDSQLWNTLAGAGHSIIQSPLLFQGGNIFAIDDALSVHGAPARLLLIGEAEIARNAALGLTKDQVLAQFKADFHAAEARVLPAASHHIDYELAPRRLPNRRFVALVNDQHQANNHVLRIALLTLRDAGLVPPDAARVLLESASPAHDHSIASVLSQFLRDPVPADTTAHFSALRAGTGESAAANEARVRCALHTFFALQPAARAATTPLPMRDFAGAVSQQLNARRALHSELKSLGWSLAPVPSISAGAASLNALNGLQLRGMFLQPTMGSSFEALNHAATSATTRALGPDIRVVPITTDETQLRQGGLRCSTSVFGPIA